MPHTHSRYQQDLGFVDGLIMMSTEEILAIASAGTVTLTRNAVGDIAWQCNASSTATFNINLMGSVLRRSGFFEDTQNLFGSTFGGGLGGSAAGPGSAGSGIPASAEPQGRPDSFILSGQPQPASGMATLQEITPRTALKIKGFKPLSINVIYKVVTNPATSLTCVLTQSVFANNVAIAKTTLLASAANGLVNVAQANPYVTNIPIPNAVYYQITPNTQLWFEVAVQEPASNTFQLYGVDVLCEFNFN
jgi:hypothetical protein